MACECDRDAIIAASVQLFHATMAQLYDGLTVPVAGSGGWWTGDWDGIKWSGVRYEGAGSTAVFAYSPGAISVVITYNLENKGTWEDVYGTNAD